MMQIVTLKDVAQEHITLALTLALVKGVCEQTPQMLRNLFATTLHYIVHSRARWLRENGEISDSQGLVLSAEAKHFIEKKA